jgi:hypothetical protein
MQIENLMYPRSQRTNLVVTALAVFALGSFGYAQDKDRNADRDRGQDRDRVRLTRLEPGTVIPIRTNDAIDVDRSDNRVYSGIVDQDVRGEDGRLAIPRGSYAELIVRVARDNDLILDLESVTVDRQRYAIKADVNRVEARRDDGIVGAILGAIDGGQFQGRAVRIPRDSVVTFRLQRPLDMGVADRGIDREGRHYHDYYSKGSGR